MELLDTYGKELKCNDRDICEMLRKYSWYQNRKINENIYVFASGKHNYHVTLFYMLLTRIQLN